MNTTSVEVTAGLGGFLVVFGLALAVWFLGRDLTRRLRRMNRAEQLRVAAQAPSVPPSADGPVREAADGAADGGAVGEEPGAVRAEPGGVRAEPGGVGVEPGGEVGDGTTGPVPPRTDA